MILTWLVKRYDNIYLGEGRKQKRETIFLGPIMTCMDKKNWGLFNRWKHQFGSDKKISPQDRVTILCDTVFFSRIRHNIWQNEPKTNGWVFLGIYISFMKEYDLVGIWSIIRRLNPQAFFPREALLGAGTGHEVGVFIFERVSVFESFQ